MKSPIIERTTGMELIKMKARQLLNIVSVPRENSKSIRFKSSIYAIRKTFGVELSFLIYFYKMMFITKDIYMPKLHFIKPLLIFRKPKHSLVSINLY